MKERNFRVAIFISGRGSNMSAIVEAIKLHRLPIDVVLVLSNAAKAAGLDYARAQGIPVAVVPRKPREWTESQFNEALVEATRPYEPDLIVLAGFMRVVGRELIAAYRNRIINIHPSLLPSFRGLEVQRRAIEEGVKFSGCSVHYVIEEVDAGPIIGQAVVPVLPQDTAEELAHRILLQEHRLLPAIVSGIAQGKISAYEKDGKTLVQFSDQIIGTQDPDALISIRPL